MTREEILLELDETMRDITDKDIKICGDKLHYCNDWDFLPIDEQSIEFDSCLCNK